jgi:hypothetical protein
MTTAGEGAEATGKQPLEYSIDGRRNPELFLPHELFDALLSGLTPDETLRVLQRGYYRDSIQGLDYDADTFWARLASVSGPYLAIRFKQGNTPYQAQCEARFEALQAARRLFGRPQFERLLYTVIAPTMQKSQTTLDGNLSSRLRDAERGCR